MNYLVLDIEVDAKTVRKRFCDPFEREHKVVMLQKKDAASCCKLLYKPEGISRRIKLDLTGINLIVGHNIKFDLLYLWQNEYLQEWIKGGGKIWDTCTAEFFLEGQNKKLSYSLSDVSVKYGGTSKIDLVEEHLKAGKLFSELDKDIALKYGAKDVTDTEAIYLQQVGKAKELGMYSIIEIHMQHLLALCEMEYNGMNVEKEVLFEKTSHQTETVDKCKQAVLDVVSTTDFPVDSLQFIVNSNDHLSALLFGGKVKYIGEEPNPTATGVTHYKTGERKGQLRTKKATLYKSMKGLQIDKTPETKKEGVYETGDGALKNVKHGAAKIILEYRKQNKLLTTYFEGYTPLINPYTGCVHTEFKTKNTATGRLASRNPNMQNLAPEMLDCFTSRFGPEGKIVELDFSQLEVCVASCVFNDSLLKAEVCNNIDLHYENAKLLFGKEDINSKERKLAKFLTFGLLYGQGAKAMSSIHNIEYNLAQKFIEVFYNKYMDIANEHNNLKYEVEQNRDGDVSYITTPTRRRYTLHEYDGKYGKNFSPTEMKNYKIQGTASDIVAGAVGQVYKYLIKYRNHVKIINEVHDSLILDVHPNCPEHVISKVKEIMESANKLPGIDLDIELSVDVEEGKSWAECKG